MPISSSTNVTTIDDNDNNSNNNGDEFSFNNDNDANHNNWHCDSTFTHLLHSCNNANNNANGKNDDNLNDDLKSTMMITLEENSTFKVATEQRYRHYNRDLFSFPSIKLLPKRKITPMTTLLSIACFMLPFCVVVLMR